MAIIFTPAPDMKTKVSVTKIGLIISRFCRMNSSCSENWGVFFFFSHLVSCLSQVRGPWAIPSKEILCLTLVRSSTSHKRWVIKKQCACMRAKLLQLCLTVCDPMGCNPSGSSVHGILQARILEWVAMPSSRGSSLPRDRTCISYISYISRQVLYHYRHLGSPRSSVGGSNSPS